MAIFSLVWAPQGRGTRGCPPAELGFLSPAGQCSPDLHQACLSSSVRSPDPCMARPTTGGLLALSPPSEPLNPQPALSPLQTPGASWPTLGTLSCPKQTSGTHCLFASWSTHSGTADHCGASVWKGPPHTRFPRQAWWSERTSSWGLAEAVWCTPGVLSIWMTLWGVLPTPVGFSVFTVSRYRHR